MNSVLNLALSVFIIGYNLSFASSYVIMESYLLSPSFSTGFTEDIPTHLACLQNAHSIFNRDLSFDINKFFNLVASASEREQPHSANGVRELLSEYNLLLKEHPYATKIISGVILAIVGDFIAQLREDRPYDVKRAAAFATFDGCYRTVQQLTYPSLIAVFQGQHILGLLESLGCTSSTASSAVFGPLEQTLISQLVIIPTIYYPAFFTITGFLQGLNFQETVERAKNRFIPLMKRNLLFWIPVQYVAFAYIPQDQQISVLIVCGLLWTVILSVSAGAVKTDDRESESNITPLPEGRLSDLNNAMESTTVMEKYEGETGKR